MNPGKTHNMADLSKQLQPIVEAIKQGKKILVFQGAGVSTKAGIPDFRSPKTGLYSNLAKLNLPYAEAVFDIDYFRDHPRAFYTLAEELYPGKYQPTSFHYFVRLLQDHDKLSRVYTQNIDTLERVAGIKDDFIVEAHGSFANNHCIDCGHEMSIDKVKSFMEIHDVPICSEPGCEGYVKPDITFFGESLPVKFFEKWDEDCDAVEFALVAGTSLTVFPFAALPSEVDPDTPRVLINKEVVGDFKTKNSKRKKDIVIKGDCDEVAIELCNLLGWTDKLNNLKQGKAKFGTVEEEVEKITKDMKDVLKEETNANDEGYDKGKNDENEHNKDSDNAKAESNTDNNVNDRTQNTAQSTNESTNSSNNDSNNDSNDSNDIQDSEKSRVSKILDKFTNMKI